MQVCRYGRTSSTSSSSVLACRPAQARLPRRQRCVCRRSCKGVCYCLVSVSWTVRAAQEAEAMAEEAAAAVPQLQAHTQELAQQLAQAEQVLHACSCEFPARTCPCLADMA